MSVTQLRSNIFAGCTRRQEALDRLYGFYDEQEDELVRTLAAQWFVEDDGDAASVMDGVRQLLTSLAKLREKNRADIRAQFERILDAAQRQRPCP